MTDEAIEAFESIKTWRQGLSEQWGGDPLAEEPAKLERIRDFCDFIDKNPDELIAYCFLKRKASGEKFASTKRREAVAELLRQYKQDKGLTGMEGRRAAADVLSFLVHNGVMMHMGMV